MGNCVSLSSNKKLKETGISSQSYHTDINDKPSNTKFLKNKTKIAKTKKKVQKGMIGLPSNFQVSVFVQEMCNLCEKLNRV